MCLRSLWTVKGFQLCWKKKPPCLKMKGVSPFHWTLKASQSLTSWICRQLTKAHLLCRRRIGGTKLLSTRGLHRRRRPSQSPAQRRSQSQAKRPKWRQWSLAKGPKQWSLAKGPKWSLAQGPIQILLMLRFSRSLWSLVGVSNRLTSSIDQTLVRV